MIVPEAGAVPPASLFFKTLLPDLVSHHLVWEESVPHKPL
jgi:hypothetical protein